MRHREPNTSSHFLHFLVLFSLSLTFLSILRVVFCGLYIYFAPVVKAPLFVVVNKGGGETVVLLQSLHQHFLIVIISSEMMFSSRYVENWFKRPPD